MYLFYVDDNSGYRKAIGVDKNVVSTISHHEYQDCWIISGWYIPWMWFKVKMIE